MQGDLARIAAKGALAGGILVLPLLFAVARTQDIATLGPFADAWWVTLVLASVGFAFAADALTSVGRGLRRGGAAMESGYDARTVGYVLADHRRDMGFLLQGGRHFSVMEPRRREQVARLRLWALMCHAVAGVWLPVALGLVLLAAARGWLEADAVWSLTLAPALLLYVVGGVLGLVEDGWVRKARSTWFRQPWASDLVGDEIEQWRGDLARRRGEEFRAAGPERRPVQGLYRTAVVVGFLTAVVAIPVLTLVPTSAIGPVLVMVALPRFGRVQQRAAEVEAFRAYVVEKDAGITAVEAGHLLQQLLYVGSSRTAVAGEVEPSERYSQAWLPEMQSVNPLGSEPHRWAEQLFARVAEGVTPEMTEYLGAVASNPAHEAFSRLARAGALDAAAGRWEDPFPVGLTMASVPIPRFGELRQGAYAHVAAAALAHVQDRDAHAEVLLREVVSVGILLGDQGPTLIENLIGHVLAEYGGTALEQFYATTGRGEEGARLHEIRAAARRSAARIHGAAPQGIEASVRTLPELVADTGTVRGLRWEFFTLTTTLTPCLNLHRMVFGPDAEYEAFVEEAHASLVRWPSEEKLFDLARAGYWGAADPANESLFGRFLGIAMRPGEGSCNNVMKRFDTLKEIM
jgi:hypothetical protein